MVATKVATHVTCPVCAHRESFRLVETWEKFKIFECPDCTLVFADPMQHGGEIYDEYYSFAVQEGVYSLRLRSIRKIEMVRKAWSLLGPFQQRAIEWLRQTIAAGSYVMDVGFGSAWMMAALEGAGFRPLGNEVAETMVAVARGKGFQVYRGEIQDYPSDWPIPAAVTHFEVLEHVTDPYEFMRTIRSRFPEAVMVFSVPSPKRWNLLWFGRETSDYPPNHLTRWNERSVWRLLTRAGYEVVSVEFPRPSGQELVYHMFQALAKKTRMEGYLGFMGERERGRGVFSLMKLMRRFVLWFYDVVVMRISEVLLWPVLVYIRSKAMNGAGLLVMARPAPIHATR